MNARPPATAALGPTAPPLTQAITALDEQGRSVALSIPCERALTLYVDKRELVTLMTLGCAPEALALGYLRNQRLIASAQEVVSIQVDWEVGAAAIHTRDGLAKPPTRASVVTSGCGQGSEFSNWLDAVAGLRLPDARWRQTVLQAMVETLRGLPSIYKQAGSVHGCALFGPDGALRYFVEDVGRHNAVDTIAGRMWLDGVQGADCAFYTTGRLTSEMVLKAAHMGLPLLLSRSGTTQLGLALAQQLHITLLTRCSGRHFLLLSAPERVQFKPSAP